MHKNLPEATPRILVLRQPLHSVVHVFNTSVREGHGLAAARSEPCPPLRYPPDRKMFRFLHQCAAKAYRQPLTQRASGMPRATGALGSACMARPRWRIENVCKRAINRDFIPVLVKKVSYLFIAPKARRELYETAQRAFARCECA